MRGEEGYSPSPPRAPQAPERLGLFEFMKFLLSAAESASCAILAAPNILFGVYVCWTECK
jgi:hypothetical protein